ncbi:MAG: glycerophosphodiester phosphodiesterase family protein [Phocaeicola sp.]
MNKIKFLPLILLLLINILNLSAQSNNSLLNLTNLEGNHIIVVSHRADWRNSPENSLQAIQNCIDMGVDMVEIDLKISKDGVVILMHDKTLDRTTTGKGKPEDYTLEELKAMRLRNGAGHKTAHQIPTLEEAMLLCKGKVLVNIDKGYDYFKEAYEVLEKTGTVKQCLIKAGLPYEQVKKENGEVLEKSVFMPIVNLEKEGAEAMIDGYMGKLNPQAFELVFANETPEVLRLIEKVRKSGAKLFINALWPELSAGHDDDRAVEKNEADESWGWILNQGAHFIQTDRPAQLLEYLRNINRHN